MKSIIEAFVERSRATILMIIVVMLIGIEDYKKIPKESNPNIQIPVIYVLTTLQGISPEDAERLLLRPIENAVRSIEGLKDLTSYANEGSASVILEFKAGFESDKAVRDVRNKIDDIVNKLPTDADKPIVKEINLSTMPVLNVILTGDIPQRELLKSARTLRDKVEALNGVLEVSLGGDLEDSLEIIVDTKNLEAQGLSIASLRQVINANNSLVAAGSLKNSTGEFSIKVPSLIKDYTDLMNYPIKANGDDVIRVKDVSEIRRTFKEPDTIARVNGKPAITLEVSKRSGENIIGVVNKIKQAVEEERGYWPAKMQVLYAQDESENIIDMVIDLENNIIFGVMLVLIVIIYSVGIKSALIISLSIPFSFLAGITFLTLMGYTLNVVVLFSLILTVGMIVDDAIVVSEYADRLMHDGTPPAAAYLTAAKRMLWPIFTSTLVKILVFMPLLFWPGVIGQFMKFMPITVIAILTNSLIFALFFQPTLGPIIGKPEGEDSEMIKSMSAADNGDYTHISGITKTYMNLLQKVLHAPKSFAIGVFAFMITVYIVFAVAGTGFEFFPKVEPTSAVLSVQAPGNLSIQERDNILKEVESKIIVFDKDVKIFYSKAGNFTSNTQTPENTIATITMEFQNWQVRRKAKDIIKNMQAAIASVQGIKFSVEESKDGPQSGKPIKINVSSRIPELISIASDVLLQKMNSMNGFKDVEDSRPSKAVEWRVIVDREKAARYGLDVGTIGSAIQLITNGLKVSTYRPDDVTDEVDILLRFPPEQRKIASLNSINIFASDGSLVPISNFVKVEPGIQVSEIKRVNRERVTTIQANVESGYLADTLVMDLKKMLVDSQFQDLLVQAAAQQGIHVSSNAFFDVKFNFKGEDESQNETGAFLKIAFMLTLVMMFIIMLIQFNNIYHTIVVMSAVFLSTTGVVLGLLITGQPFGVVMCGIGIIALGGIVLNNNIIFIDTYQHLRAEKIACYDAILRAGIQRLRPILLTATTAILGLLPMVFGLTINFTEREILYDAPSSQWWRQLSASIAGGLSFATILTLFFTPALLLIGKRFDVKDPQ